MTDEPRLSPPGRSSTARATISGAVMTSTRWNRRRALEGGHVDEWERQADYLAGGRCPELGCGARFAAVLEHEGDPRFAIEIEPGTAFVVCAVHPNDALRLFELRQPVWEDDEVGDPVIERRPVAANRWQTRRAYR